MITEDYCSFEVAKLLKEKGFEIDTNRDYWKIGEDGTMYFMSSIGAYTSNPYYIYAIYRPENSYPCPTIQMALKWLREVHNIMASPYALSLGYYFEIFDLTNRDITGCKPLYKVGVPAKEDVLNTYKEACEEAIKYCLEKLI